MPIRRRDLHLHRSGPRARAASRTTWPLLAAFACVLFGPANTGCGGEEASPEAGGGETAANAGSAAEGEGSAGTHAPREPAAESGPPKRVFAKRFVVNIRSEPSHEAERLGYMRGGAVIQAKTAAPAHRDDGCPRGWFELTTGGFVCNGRDVVAFDGDRLPEGRALQPDLEAALPYQYGRVRSKAPLYRRVPNDEEAAQFEGYVIPGSVPAEGTDVSAAAGEAGEAAAPVAAQTSPEPSTAPPAPSGATLAAVAAPTIAGAVDPAAPPEPLTLGTLMGESGSAVYRYLVPGFIVSLDRVFRSGERRYYRTQNNGFVPYSKIGPRTGSDFTGVELPEGGPTLPIAFAVRRQVAGFERAENGRMRPSRVASLPYHGRIVVVAEEQDGDTTYLRTADNHYYRAEDLTVIRALPRPAEVPEGAQWIDVNLTDQTLVAYEGDRPVFATLVSTGRVRRPGVEDLDHRTPAGVYQIRAKHVTTTMDGDSAFDGPYSIEDVPYVMYFHGAYAIHSAFWHDRFGHTRSHGCVNMAPLDARFMFRWAGPQVRAGWHGSFPTAGNAAAWVIVRGETPLG